MLDKSHTINTLHANFQSQAHLAQLNGSEKSFTYNLLFLYPKLTEK